VSAKIASFVELAFFWKHPSVEVSSDILLWVVWVFLFYLFPWLILKDWGVFISFGVSMRNVSLVKFSVAIHTYRTQIPLN